MKVDFFRQFVDDIGDGDTTIAGDGKSSAEFTGWVDTGSYIVNAALSGTMFGGMPNNKALVLAGDPATGKTFFALGIVRNFLQTNPRARVMYFDTESAVTNKMLEDRGIDVSRVAKSEPDSIEKFRRVAVTLLDRYAAIEASERFPLLMVLDSLSALPSLKEVTDVTEGKDTKDMTKPGLLKGTFRILRLKLAKLQVPMLVTNHVYAQIGAYMPTKVMAGGSGAVYAADSIALLSKSKERNDEKDVTGSIIHVKMEKSRLSREQTKCDTLIRFDGGLDRYYGLLDYAVEAGMVKKVSTRYQFPDGTKAFEKAINKNPEQFYTEEFLRELDTYMQTQFTYTAGTDVSEDAATADHTEDSDNDTE